MYLDLFFSFFLFVCLFVFVLIPFWYIYLCIYMTFHFITYISPLQLLCTWEAIQFPFIGQKENMIYTVCQYKHVRERERERERESVCVTESSLPWACTDLSSFFLTLELHNSHERVYTHTHTHTHRISFSITYTYSHTAMAEKQYCCF